MTSYPGDEELVIGQVVHGNDVVQGLEAVALHALVVVDVGPLLLRHGEPQVVVQIPLRLIFCIVVMYSYIIKLISYLICNCVL